MPLFNIYTHMMKTFRKWLEDTGEVGTAAITNDSLKIPSKWTGGRWERKNKIRCPFMKKKMQSK